MTKHLTLFTDFTALELPRDVPDVALEQIYVYQPPFFFCFFFFATPAFGKLHMPLLCS